jgi:hypothetical protein
MSVAVISSACHVSLLPEIKGRQNGAVDKNGVQDRECDLRMVNCDTGCEMNGATDQELEGDMSVIELGLCRNPTRMSWLLRTTRYTIDHRECRC